MTSSIFQTDPTLFVNDLKINEVTVMYNRVRLYIGNLDDQPKYRFAAEKM